jgi:hypothetical protein
MQVYTMRSAPVLSFEVTSGLGLLSWPWPAPGFAVQHNTDLSTTNWQTTAVAPVLTNWQYQATVFPANPQDFFRLISP